MFCLGVVLGWLCGCAFAWFVCRLQALERGPTQARVLLRRSLEQVEEALAERN